MYDVGAGTALGQRDLTQSLGQTANRPFAWGVFIMMVTEMSIIRGSLACPPGLKRYPRE